MGRSGDGLNLEGLVLDPSQPMPMHRQLYNQVRQMILTGVLQRGTRIPSTRTFSERLGVSRFTVVTAMDQLLAEGYLRSVAGSGTFVENILTDAAPTAKSTGVVTGESATITELRLSRRARALYTWPDSANGNITARRLLISAPDPRLFPHQIWTKLTKETFARIDDHLAIYKTTNEPSLLEQQIAEHVAISRGVKCSPEQVVATFGAHHAVNLMAELFLDPGDSVAFEEPGMPAVRAIFSSYGCNIISMPVDGSGANPAGINDPNIKLAFVTAAKQQPLSVSMPIGRKIELLGWARDRNAIILEDDLGSEYRYQGRPIPPLKALDEHDQVVYIGAFSMSLLQTIRAGFLIMRKDLAAHCRNLIRVRYRATPQLQEQILARFIQDGHYARHLHKTRRIYARRQTHMMAILDEDFSDVFEPVERSTGFDCICYLRDQSVDDEQVVARGYAAGIRPTSLSRYYSAGQTPRKGFILGFASTSEEEITASLRVLRKILSETS